MQIANATAGSGCQGMLARDDPGYAIERVSCGRIVSNALGTLKVAWRREGWMFVEMSMVWRALRASGRELVTQLVSVCDRAAA